MAQISMKQSEKLDGVIELLSLQQQQLNNIDNQLELLKRMCEENSNALNILEGEIEEIKTKL